MLGGQNVAAAEALQRLMLIGLAQEQGYAAINVYTEREEKRRKSSVTTPIRRDGINYATDCTGVAKKSRTEEEAGGNKREIARLTHPLLGGVRQ